MKKKFPVPLMIDCDGLSNQRIKSLAEHLNEHFYTVEIIGTEITASEPANETHYGIGWNICERYGVKVSY